MSTPFHQYSLPRTPRTPRTPKAAFPRSTHSERSLRRSQKDSKPRSKRDGGGKYKGKNVQSSLGVRKPLVINKPILSEEFTHKAILRGADWHMENGQLYIYGIKVGEKLPKVALNASKKGTPPPQLEPRTRFEIPPMKPIPYRDIKRAVVPEAQKLHTLLMTRRPTGKSIELPYFQGVVIDYEQFKSVTYEEEKPATEEETVEKKKKVEILSLETNSGNFMEIRGEEAVDDFLKEVYDLFSMFGPDYAFLKDEKTVILYFSAAENAGLIEIYNYSMVGATTITIHPSNDYSPDIISHCSILPIEKAAEFAPTVSKQETPPPISEKKPTPKKEVPEEEMMPVEVATTLDFSTDSTPPILPSLDLEDNMAEFDVPQMPSSQLSVTPQYTVPVPEDMEMMPTAEIPRYLNDFKLKWQKEYTVKQPIFDEPKKAVNFFGGTCPPVVSTEEVSMDKYSGVEEAVPIKSMGDERFQVVFDVDDTARHRYYKQRILQEHNYDMHEVMETSNVPEKSALVPTPSRKKKHHEVDTYTGGRKKRIRKRRRRPRKPNKTVFIRTNVPNKRGNDEFIYDMAKPSDEEIMIAEYLLERTTLSEIERATALKRYSEGSAPQASTEFELAHMLGSKGPGLYMALDSSDVNIAPLLARPWNQRQCSKTIPFERLAPETRNGNFNIQNTSYSTYPHSHVHFEKFSNLDDEVKEEDDDMVFARKKNSIKRLSKAMRRSDINPNIDDHGCSKKLSVVRSLVHAWGVVSEEPIRRDEFVCEYCGEVIRHVHASRREKDYLAGGLMSFYLFRLDTDVIIDPTRKGNIARYINHSCEPNCTAKIFTHNNNTRIAIYALRDIAPGEELFYDYHLPWEGVKKAIPCLCGSKSCKKFLNIAMCPENEYLEALEVYYPDE
ncbi:hypothetical protein PCE1_000797 [Barthelona sp. PCE]